MGRVQRNKTACVHYVVPKQQTRTGYVVPGNKKHNTITTPQPHPQQTGAGHVVTTDFPTPGQPGKCGTRVTAVIAWGKRPVPSRTRKLRPTAPMVLHPGGCGRVGHRRTTIRSRASNHQVGGSPTLTPQPAPRTRERPARPAERQGASPDSPHTPQARPARPFTRGRTPATPADLVNRRHLLRFLCERGRRVALRRCETGHRQPGMGLYC